MIFKASLNSPMLLRDLLTLRGFDHQLHSNLITLPILDQSYMAFLVLRVLATMQLNMATLAPVQAPDQ